MLAFTLDQEKRIAQAGFTARLVQRWESNFPAILRTLTPDQRHALAALAQAQASARGLTREADIFAWADLCIAARTGFARVQPGQRQA